MWRDRDQSTLRWTDFREYQTHEPGASSSWFGASASEHLQRNDAGRRVEPGIPHYNPGDPGTNARSILRQMVDSGRGTQTVTDPRILPIISREIRFKLLSVYGPPFKPLKHCF